MADTPQHIINSRKRRGTGATQCHSRARRGCREGEPLTLLIESAGPYQCVPDRIRPRMETILPEDWRRE